MDKIIKRLVNVSSFLDEVGENSISSNIDKTASNILKIVEAQYVGVQGYWIRNSRCWPNCYRIKRAKNKEMPAQEVWQECHKEYLESVKGNNETWDKYAEKDNKSLSKFSEAGFGDKLKEVLSMESSEFDSLLKKNIDNGLSIGVAVDEAIHDGVSKYENAIVSQADNLVKIATKLEEMGYKKAAAELGDISAEIIKQAGLWDWLKGKMGLQTSAYKGIIQSLQGLASMAATKYNEAWQTAMQGSSTKQEVQQKFDQWAINNANIVIDLVSTKANEIAGVLASPSVDQGAKIVGQAAIRLLNKWGGQFAQAPSMNLLRGLQENIRNALAGIEQVVQQQVAKQQSPAGAAAGTPGAAAGTPGAAAGTPGAAPAAPAAPITKDQVMSFIDQAVANKDAALLTEIRRKLFVPRGQGKGGRKPTAPAAPAAQPAAATTGTTASIYNNRKIKIGK